MPSKKITFIDLFCGMGGFRIAFEKQNCKCIFSSDIDRYARETYKLNFGEYPSGDITEIDSKEIPNFDVLCAGFPCQPFSIAGKRRGFNDTRGTLFFEVARILKDKKPKAFILENVRGIVNHDNGNTIQVILNTLQELGYDVISKVINAKDYGVPQNRERWYCVGFRKDLMINTDEFSFGVAKKLQFTLRDIIQTNVDKKYQVSNLCLSNIERHIVRKKISISDYTLAYEIRPSRCQFTNNGCSPCLTAKMGTGGNNVPVIICQKRKFTETECLRLMGFPDSFKVYGKSQAYKQIGNSVVVPVITTIAKGIVNELRRIKYENNRG